MASFFFTSLPTSFHDTLGRPLVQKISSWFTKETPPVKQPNLDDNSDAVELLNVSQIKNMWDDQACHAIQADLQDVDVDLQSADDEELLQIICGLASLEDS